MNTIQNRIDNSKLAAPIHPRADASNMIADAVAKFEALGGVITTYEMGESNYKSTTQKAVDDKKRRKAGIHFAGKS